MILMNPVIESGNVGSAAFCYDCMYLYREVVVSQIGTSTYTDTHSLVSSPRLHVLESSVDTEYPSVD